MMKFMRRYWKQLLILWYFLTALVATVSIVVVHATATYLYTPAVYVQGIASATLAFAFSNLSLSRTYLGSKPTHSLLAFAGVVASVIGLLIALTDPNGGWFVVIFAAGSIGLSLHVAAEQTRWGRHTEMIVSEMIVINVSIIMASFCLLVFPTIMEEYATRTYALFVIAAITSFPVLNLSFDITRALAPSPKNIGLGFLSAIIIGILVIQLGRPIGEQSTVVFGMMLGVAILPVFVTMLLIGKKLNLKF